MYNIFSAIKMHRAILSHREKQYFLLLSLLSFVGSLFDMVGIGAIGFFMLLMTKPSLFQHLPVLNSVLPMSWPIYHVLMLLGTIILLVFSLKTIFNCFLQKYLISFCFNVGTRIRMQLMEKYLYAPYSYFIKTHTTTIMNYVSNYVAIYSNLGFVSFMLLCVNLIFVVTIISFLFFFHPLVTAMLLAVFFTVFFINKIVIRDRLYNAGETLNASNESIAKSIQEGLFGIKEIRVLSRESFILKKILSAAKISASSYSLISTFQKLPLYLFESALFAFVIVLCLIELSLHVNVQTIVALCGMLVAAGARLLPSLYQIAASVSGMQSSHHAVEGIHRILFDMSSVSAEAAWCKDENLHTTNKHSSDFSIISLNDISYRYSGVQHDALSSITLQITRGQSVGIVGPSGAGKTTLVDLLLGLLSPTQGKILIDGKPLTNKQDWVTRFAYIPQIIYLLDDSLKKNITFGEEDSLFDEARFQKALSMAQLLEVVAALPQGVETSIGEDGIKLSGGQRQRIALARAFYYERDIIVMDEATAALDNETEAEVVNAINSLHQLKTLIIIAHRHSTVANCDVIYRLEQGRIVESGTFEAVIGNAALKTHHASMAG